MELLTLRTFLTVVEEGGVLAASRKLNTVQSNVTSRVQRLEEELGVELFFRTGRGLELTPSGRVLLDYARRLLLLEQQTVSAIRLAGENVGDLRIGTTETFAFMYLPTALLALRKKHPALGLRIHTDTGSALVEKVLAHNIDCALTSGPVSHPDLVFDELVVEDLVQVSATKSDPVQLPAILFRDGCAYRARALAWQRAIGHATADIMEFGTLDGILGCVSAGLGWTLLPQRVIERSPYSASLTTKPIPADIGRVPTGIVRLQAAPPLPAMATFNSAILSATLKCHPASRKNR
jgi:DNA-binding transcriptional LysR family regulator